MENNKHKNNKKPSQFNQPMKWRMAESNHHLNELTRNLNKNFQLSTSSKAFKRIDIDFNTKKIFYNVFYNWFDIHDKKI